jgi:serine phosphatase RsbU (regulator of sigma subunit)
MQPQDQQTGSRLIVRRELLLIGTFVLDDRSITIGRSPRCDIHLRHEAVSRTHARLESRDGGWHLIDDNSANGILVNGRRTRSTRLTPGDVISIRPFSLNFLGGLPGNQDPSISLSDKCEHATVITNVSPQNESALKQRLEDLYALARLVIHRKDNGSFWQGVHSALRHSLAADRCLLLGFDPEAGIYRLAPQAITADSDASLPVSRTVLDDVIQSGRAVFVQRVGESERYGDAQSLVGRAAGSVACVPVRVSGRTRAVVYAERNQSRPPFSNDDLSFMVAALDLAATAVGMDELHEQSKELARVRGRVETGRAMQRMLLPSPLPHPAWGRVAARNDPADQMSGDIYGAVVDSKGRLVVSLADVSGKGVPAAFVTAILQNTLRQALLDIEDLGDVVRRLNHTLHGCLLPDCFATMVLCRWSPSADAIEIANAGHHPPLGLNRAGTVESYPTGASLPLGIVPEWPGEIASHCASDLVAMLLFSDGVTEAKNPKGEEFGTERLTEAFARLASSGEEALVKAIATEVRSFCAPRENDDDVTLLAVNRHAEVSARP